VSYILIVGAKSDIAKEVAKVYAENGYDLYLAGRHILTMKDFANDIKIRSGVDVKLKELDITDFDSHKCFCQELEGDLSGVITVVGYMNEQRLVQNDWDETLNTIHVNYLGNVSLLNIIANSFEKIKHGFIIGVSSVAGDRGRKSNYIYGSAKAGFSAYLSGLRSRLYNSDVQVLTVKPGFVYTKMTENLDLPKALTAMPSDVAIDIYTAHKSGKDVLYTKFVWRYIMLIIKHLPEFIFKRTSF